MRELLVVFQEVEDPRRGNAKRHDLHEMLVIALLSTLTGGRACVEMEDYGCAAERLAAGVSDAEEEHSPMFGTAQSANWSAIVHGDGSAAASPDAVQRSLPL